MRGDWDYMRVRQISHLTSFMLVGSSQLKIQSSLDSFELGEGWCNEQCNVIKEQGRVLWCLCHGAVCGHSVDFQNTDTFIWESASIWPSCASFVVLVHRPIAQNSSWLYAVLWLVEHSSSVPEAPPSLRSCTLPLCRWASAGQETGSRVVS